MKTSVPGLILLFLASLLAFPAAQPQAAVATAEVRHELLHPNRAGALRVLHASPDTGRVDVWVDGERTLRGVALGTASD